MNGDYVKLVELFLLVLIDFFIVLNEFMYVGFLVVIGVGIVCYKVWLWMFKIIIVDLMGQFIVSFFDVDVYLVLGLVFDVINQGFGIFVVGINFCVFVILVLKFVVVLLVVLILVC